MAAGKTTDKRGGVERNEGGKEAGLCVDRLAV